MREIKFRIWDEDRYVPEGWHIGNKIYSMRNCQSVDPNEEALEQFTGLRDKNGREIYEGDIVRIYHVRLVTDGPIHKPRIAAIEWSVDECGFRMVGHDVRSTNPDIYPTSHLEVIGNIRENPELLND